MNAQSVATGKFWRRARARFNAMHMRHGVRAFIASLPLGARLLDIGCGNNSPFKAKTQRPDLYYIGFDVADYNQTAPILADRYIVATGENFAAEIEAFAGSVDAVVSSHNIEHCDEPERVLRAMANALEPGGWLYLSFPSLASTDLPRRAGCLNFFDDPTHRSVPDFDDIARRLEEAGCTIEFAERRYRPPLMRAIGAVLEPWSRARCRVMPGTWALYGFESIMWARRTAPFPHRTSRTD